MTICRMWGAYHFTRSTCLRGVDEMGWLSYAVLNTIIFCISILTPAFQRELQRASCNLRLFLRTSTPPHPHLTLASHASLPGRPLAIPSSASAASATQRASSTSSTFSWRCSQPPARYSVNKCGS